MNRIWNTLAIVLICSTAFSQNEYKRQPDLVVGIVIDQMRYDYLTRFWDEYGKNGFRRMVKKGKSCTNAHFNYIPTKTGPGHASVYTGSDPSVHGICGNSWYDYDLGRLVNCIEDTSIKDTAKYLVAGKSPRNLLTENLADRFKMEHGYLSKVYSVSIKDRGAILPGGHKADGAYWYNDENGHFVTSSYYQKDTPIWLDEFNQRKLQDKYMEYGWQKSTGSYITDGLKDDRPYEAGLGKDHQRVMPYFLSKLRGESDYSTFKYTPFGNTMTLDLAKLIVEKEDLGKNSKTDLLMVSLSSTDYVGHLFGPNSHEIKDTYLKLDKDLAEFIKVLENKLGKRNILIFLTADHGVMEIPEYLEDNHIPAGRYSTPELRKELNNYLEGKHGVSDASVDISNFNVYFSKDVLGMNRNQLKEIKHSTIEFLQKKEYVKLAVDGEQMASGKVKDPLLLKAARGYVPSRGGGVVFLTEPGWIPSGHPNGTTHGSGYNYDTHVPLIFYGWKVKHRNISERRDIKDIVPTLCDKLKIAKPAGSDGDIIEITKCR